MGRKKAANAKKVKPPWGWNAVVVKKEGHSMGSKKKIHADMEALDPLPMRRDQQRAAVSAGEMTGRDVFLSMHYRAAKVQEMARRLNVDVKTIHEMLGLLYEETDRELINSPEEMKMEVGGTMMRWTRKLDVKIMEDKASPAELRAGIMLLSQLAKLTGANSPELQIIRNYNTTATVDINKIAEQKKELETAEILNDPVMRDAMMVIEMRRLELQNAQGNGNPPQKRIAARVLPSGGQQAGGATVPRASSHPDDDDESDEVSGA